MRGWYERREREGECDMVVECNSVLKDVYDVLVRGGYINRKCSSSIILKSHPSV